MVSFACLTGAVPGARSSWARCKLSSATAPRAVRYRLSYYNTAASCFRKNNLKSITYNSGNNSSRSSVRGMSSKLPSPSPPSASTPSAPPPTTSRVASLPTVWNTVNGCSDPLPDPSSGTLKWYSCGPTVYDSSHLGHARTYVSLDILRRILTDYFRYDITYALGITDIDDKIIARARERGLTDWPDVAGMAAEYEGQFMEDMEELGVRPPDAVTRVTDHVPDIIAYVERIVENGMAYEAEGGVYFDVEGMGSDYGKLGVQAAGSTTPEGEGGSDLRGKRSHKDFALWKKAKEGEPWWDSPFGKGRPGWHIECSAMTHSLFGSNLDLHSGGVDLKFPHHTNEIAQCEAYGCGGVLAEGAGVAGVAEAGPGGAGAGGGARVGARKPWVRHWVHTGHLNIEGLKMSKSLKNFVTVREFLEGHRDGREAAAEDFRMFCLMHKYSSSVTFSEDRMEEASVVRGRFQRFLALADAAIGDELESRRAGAERRWGDREKRLVAETSTCRREVRLALSDDFDTPRAVRHLAALCALISTHLKDLEGGALRPVVSAANYAAEALALLGVGSSGGRSGGEIGRRKGGLAEAGGGAGSAEGLPPARDVIEAMVDFRRLARKYVLERNLKKNLASAKLMKRDLLQLLDYTRDETLPRLGVHVHDDVDNECMWILLPPNRRHGRQQPDDDHRQPDDVQRQPDEDKNRDAAQGDSFRAAGDISLGSVVGDGGGGGNRESPPETGVRAEGDSSRRSEE